MRAVVFSGPGGNEVIDLVERPDPIPTGDDVLVAVRYAGLNPTDVPHLETGRISSVVDQVSSAAKAAAMFDRLQSPGKLGKVLRLRGVI